LSIKRRTFIASALVSGVGLLAARTIRPADARIEVLINEPLATISPEIYGHFIEHLGGVIYDGVWVGEGSKIPNIGGIRKALVEHMRKLKPGVVRWPGGCFADSYDWRDGVGLRQTRPQRTNFWINESGNENSPLSYDSNEFGTNEFLRFCKLVGTEPYIAANVRSLTAKDFYQWVEYCNSPAGMTTLSKLREASGDREPFNVCYWGVGNESWGCGGDMTGDEYADHFKRFAAWVPRYGVKPELIGSGPTGADLQWTRLFLSRLTERREAELEKLYGWALHFYARSTGKGDPFQFSQDEWYELLGKADRMEALISAHWSVMGEIDKSHRVKLIVDEWGAWHNRESDMPEKYLWAYSGTLRDALVSALTLDIFNRHADKVVIANVAQLVNTIHSLFLTNEEKFLATVNYHVFEMYSAHQGGQSLRTVFSAPTLTYKAADKVNSLWGLQGSASLKDKQLVLTVVNPHHSQTRETEIAIRGAAIKTGQSRTLTAGDLHAHNSFEQPRAVEPRDEVITLAGSAINYQFPPSSVTCLRFDLV
jgi:alpha-N-arabinofuranosidase